MRFKLFLSCMLFITMFVIVYGQNMPNTYVANKAMDNFVIDGVAAEASWKKAAWSEPYIDIEGKKKPKYDTQMKMTWDDQNLYLYAELKEPHIWANLKQRDTIIFYNNDFEIFIDPDGDTHNYYEFEMNALNTVWDLFLSKPYRNHGKVLGDWDFKGLKSAVHIDGSLNDPSDIDQKWSVEVAIPWSFTAEPGGATKVPRNEFWRMNFSRVNWDFDLVGGKYYRKKDEVTKKFLPEYNWVWSPQEVINMHEPERWGYVYFSTEVVGSETTFKIPKEEHIKWYLYELFRKYSESKEVKIVAEKEILGQMISPKLSIHDFGWVIWANSPFTQNRISIKEDGRIEIRKND